MNTLGQVAADRPIHLPNTSRPRLHLGKLGWAVRGAGLVAIVALVAWGLPRNPTYREWRISRMSLAELQHGFSRHQDDPVYLYYFGRRLMEAGNAPAADPVLRHAVGLDPDSAPYRDEWARALLASGLTTAAFGELREFVGTHPNNPEAHVILGRFYSTQRSMRRAAEEFARAVELDPSLADGWSGLAAARDAMGDRERALDAIERALALRRSKPADVLEHASLLASVNRTDEANREYERVCRLAPNWSVAHREYARWLEHTGIANRRQVASEQAARAVALDAGDADASLILGRISAELGKLPDAERALLHSATLDRDNPAPAQELARLYRQSSRLADSEKWEREYASRQSYAGERTIILDQVRSNPSDPEPHKRLAHMLGLHGDVGGCVHNYAMASRCAVDSPVALIPAANALADGGYGREAVPLAQRAVQVADSNPAAHEALGNALLAAGQPDLARREYNKTITWVPQRIPVLRKRLEAYYTDRAAHPSAAETAYLAARSIEQSRVGPKQITPEVEQLAGQAAALEPTNVKYLWYLLRVQMALRKDDEAIATGNRILAVSPKDGRAHARLAVLLVDRLRQPNGPEAAVIEAHLKAAAAEPSTVATRHYVAGLLALARKQAPAAVRELREAARLDPLADVTFYKLALAERACGELTASDKSMTEYRRRQDAKRQEMAVLGDIAQHPNQPDLYDRAIRFYTQLGLSAEAAAIRSEANRRFGHHKAISVALSRQ